MYKNNIMGKMNRERQLKADLRRLAEGLRVKNDLTDYPQVLTSTIAEGYAIIDCGEAVKKAARMSECILSSKDLRSFCEVNAKFRPVAERSLRTGAKGTPVPCLRINFKFQ